MNFSWKKLLEELRVLIILIIIAFTIKATLIEVYVVPRNSPPLKTIHPRWSVLDEVNQGVQDVILIVGSPEEQQGEVHFTIGMPGHLLDSGTVDLTDGWARIVYEPLALRKIFPNIDISGRLSDVSGLADTVWINVLLEADSGGFYARQFTLQGPDLLIPLLEGERR